MDRAFAYIALVQDHRINLSSSARNKNTTVNAIDDLYGAKGPTNFAEKSAKFRGNFC